MENKKNLKVNCAVCDVRNITEDLLSTRSEERRVGKECAA